MTTIAIPEFAGYTEADIRQFLEIEDPRLIDVHVPMIWQGACDMYMDADNYTYGAYAGQLISDLSVEFFYNMPCEEQSTRFEFMIVCDEREQLAALLYRLLCAWAEDDANFDFLMHAYENIDNYEGKECACPGYIEYMNRRFSEEE